MSKCAIKREAGELGLFLLGNALFKRLQHPDEHSQVRQLCSERRGAKNIHDYSDLHKLGHLCILQIRTMMTLLTIYVLMYVCKIKDEQAAGFFVL